MGASSSRPEEDKALQLCRERKKFVRQALDGRCSLAANHVTYISSLKVIGNALRRFVETEVPVESTLHFTTTTTPEIFALAEKSRPQFSFPSASMSQQVGTAPSLFPSPSPSLPTSSQFKMNHMKVRGMFSRKVVEKPPIPVTGSVTSLDTPMNSVPQFGTRSRQVEEMPSEQTPNKTTPQSVNGPEISEFDTSPLPPETPPWDYFGLFHPIDNNDFLSQEGTRSKEGLKDGDDIWRFGEEERVPELENEEEEKGSSHGKHEFEESEDEFDEPSTEKLVRSFENVNRTTDHIEVSASSSVPSAKNVVSKSEILIRGKHNSPDLSPIRATNSVPIVEKTEELDKEDGVESKGLPRYLISSMKTIESLFAKASESGEVVPRMLEANKFHFRPIFPGKERGSMTSVLLKSCFSCGDDPSQGQEEPGLSQTTTKYLTWHRTTSSRSSSSRNPLGANTREDMEADLTNNLFDNFCMNAGSHASTLDRLFAWERKLYDEVKASEMLRSAYDQKRKILRELESDKISSHKIDKTRAIVKDLHSRIGVAIHRINSISRKIEDLRDKELQPQLEELIEGLRRMWEVMHSCHTNQLHIISVAFSTNNAHPKASISDSDSRRQITMHLEYELNVLSSSFTKWIGSQETYVQALNEWLYKCVSLQQKSSSKRKRRLQTPPLRNYGPPIYKTCGVWLDLLRALSTKQVVDSIKNLETEISRFLPRQEKNQGKHKHHDDDDVINESGVNLLSEQVSEDLVTRFDRLRSSMVAFIAELNNYAGGSVKMLTELQTSIQEAKSSYMSKGATE